MSIETSLSIDRTSLSLSPLLLTNNPFDSSPFTYPEEGLAEPNFSMRVHWAPDSAWVPGRLALGSVLDATTLPLTVYVEGTSIADLIARKAELAAAVGQLDYSVTMTVDSVEVGTWPAGPTAPWWGIVDHGLILQRRALATIAIPVNPPIGA